MKPASLALVSACALRPHADALAPWTTALRDHQGDSPYVTVYARGRYRLVVVAAVHDNDPARETFRLIDAACARWPPALVIVEGTPAAAGINPAALVALGDEAAVAGVQRNGETVPAVRCARRHAAAVIGGEVDDRIVAALASRDGIDRRDLLGFYVLRVLPQWRRDGTVNDVTDLALDTAVDRQLDLSRATLNLPPDVLPDARAWRDWYRRRNGKPLDATFSDEEVGPLADGRLATQHIASAVSRARDTYLHRITIEQLRRYKRVMVVFGGSHEAIQRPALTATLGRPCFVGGDLKAAALGCGR